VAWFGPNLKLQESLGWAVVLAGMSGVVCSIMIYRSTHRRFWSGSATSLKFLLTTLALGAATMLLTSVVAAACAPVLQLTQVLNEYGASLAKLLIAAAGTKLLFEATSLRHLRAKQNSPAKRSAVLMTGPLARTTAGRFACGLVGGVVLPALLLAHVTEGRASPSGPFVGVVVLASFVACLIGELLERFLFFTAVVAPRMPGRLVT
jgi:DMSO reductase anchor subunit